ncbi:MAG: nucleotide exchange factor GrpE [Dissulfuribacterales bacterium]
MKKDNTMWKFLSKFRRKSQLSGNTADSDRTAWKEKVLTDFKAWLDDLPESGMPADGQQPDSISPDGIQMDACDLYTLLTEFTALRQEIKLQNREQNKAIRIHGDLMEKTKEYAVLFKDRTQSLENLEERIRMVCETQTVEQFFDIHDSLVRGIEAVRTAIDKGIYFRRSSRQRMAGVMEGYEMALRRFDRVLSKFGITPVVCIGRPFNSSLMRAVGKQSDPKKEGNIVLEEHLCGFVRGEEVLRTAEVIVNNK